MDRKSKPEIAKLVLSFLAILLPAGLFSGKLFYEKQLLNLQIKELSTLYPEQAEWLFENLSYYHKKVVRENIWFMGLVIFIELLFFAGFYLYRRQLKKKQTEKMKSELHHLSEKIYAMRSGVKTEVDIFPKFSFGIIEDIYEQLRELEYDISSMQTQLTEEERRTKSLITDISHQLKTPLASIRMSHDLSLSDDLSKEERRSFLDMETNEILKLEALLDELVKLSRLENNMIQIHPENCSLKDVIREAVSSVFLKAKAKNIELLVEIEKDFMLSLDRRWTAEAFTNLIENAVKYSKAGSMVQLRVSPLIQNVLIEIEDDGIGIPEGEQHQIFKRFYRGSNAVLASKEGAGVGLYLARKIIEQHGGTIVVKPKHGQGSIFKITLPL